jgi:hypothetical protein
MTMHNARDSDDRSSDQVSPNWKKASLSYSTGGCVEVATVPDLVRVRDSKNPSGTVLGLSSASWTAFMGEIQGGRFDRT